MNNEPLSETPQSMPVGAAGESADGFPGPAIGIQHQGKATEMARGAGARMGACAAYLRTHDFKDTLGELGRMVRSHPTESLAGAAATGFLLGTVLRPKQ